MAFAFAVRLEILALLHFVAFACRDGEMQMCLYKHWQAVGLLSD
jgi:hypothetical protein